MLKKLFCVSITLLVICFSLFPKSKKVKVKYPLWINEPYSVYDKNSYFVTVGSDKNKNLAELNAVEELAGIFGKDIKSTTTAESTMTETEQNHITDFISEQNLDSQIMVNVDQRNLLGVEIKESFLDETNNIWYSLAVLDKEKACQIYQKEIQNCYKSIDENFQASKKTKNTFDKLGYIYKCKQTAQYTQSLFSRLQVIDFNKAETLRREDIYNNMYSIELNNITSSLPLSISINEDYNDEIKTVCTKVFEGFGFKFSHKSDYILKINIDNSYRTVTNPEAVYCESTLSIKLHSKDGSILFPFNYSGRAGAKTEELALKKQYSLLSNIIQTDYKQEIQNVLLQE